MPLRRRLLPLGGLLLVLGLAHASSSERGLSVRTAPARVGALAVRVITNGKVEPVEGLEVRSRFAGRVVEAARAGAHVAEGETLVRLDDTAVAAALASAQTERMVAEEAMLAARGTYAHARARAAVDRRLVDGGALAPAAAAESEAAEAEEKARMAGLERRTPSVLAGIDLRIQELTADRREACVVAPFAGTVYRAQVKPGDMVQAGASLLWLADLGRLRVRASIDQTDLGQVRPAQTVRVSSDAYGSRVWSGHVERLLSEVTTRDGRAVCDGIIAIDAGGEGLVPGMTVDLDIEIARADAVLEVPNDAVFHDQESALVYRIDEDRVRRTPVKLGRVSVVESEILQGLVAGDVVVVGPVEGLSDGARVVRDAPAAGRVDGRRR